MENQENYQFPGPKGCQPIEPDCLCFRHGLPLEKALKSGKFLPNFPDWLIQHRKSYKIDMLPTALKLR
jgi:hypothetical protein